jgi:hypothetical protein
MLVIALAGSLLGFYADTVPHDQARLGLILVGLGVFCWAEWVVAVAPIRNEFPT